MQILPTPGNPGRSGPFQLDKNECMHKAISAKEGIPAKLHKVGAFDDATVFNVEAGNDSLGKHEVDRSSRRVVKLGKRRR